MSRPRCIGNIGEQLGEANRRQAGKRSGERLYGALEELSE